MTLTSRHDFGRLLDAMHAQTGVELGVASGAFTDRLLSSSKLRTLTGVDKWNDERHPESEKATAEKRLAKHGGRAQLVASTFEEALPRFPDGSLDFVYIDGYAHTGQEDGKTLEDWWPKLKPGGIFAGHDYHVKWPKTVSAVNRFAVKVDLPLFLTSGDEFPSWYVFKPGGVMKGGEPLMPARDDCPIPEGKTCVLVGNGPSLKANQWGQRIDAFDEVVRFNDYVLCGFEESTGRKTTIWATGGANKMPVDSTQAEPVKPAAPKVIMVRGGHVVVNRATGQCHAGNGSHVVINREPPKADPSALPPGILFMNGDTGNPGYAPEKLWRIPLTHYYELRAKVRALSKWDDAKKENLIPSKGLQAATWLIQRGVPQLTLAGFDHFSQDQSAAHHYWLKGPFSLPSEHDPEVEAALFAELADAGKVVYLR